MRTDHKTGTLADRFKGLERDTGAPRQASADSPNAGSARGSRGLVRRWLQSGRLTKAEIIGSAACALTLTLWNFAAQGAVTPGAGLFFALFCITCTLAGRSAARLVGPDAARDFPTVFLFGFFLFNSALYLLAWISPFSILVNALVLLAVVLVLQRPPDRRPTDGSERTSLWAVAICLVASTFWSQDSITPQDFENEIVLLRPWIDSYFHASEIRLFRDAHGLGSLHDLRMADRPVWIYHHASYLTAALASAATSTSTFLTFGSFYVPFGVVLSGLAAYALIRSLWGSGAGVAAMAALLLLPDASRQMMGNRFLSYHWLQQIGPGGLYGVSILAVAWLLMFEGCRAGRLGLVVMGLVTAGAAAHYKSHLFVAAALLIWLYPGLFYRGARWRWKGAWLVLGLGLFVLVAKLAEPFESVPTLRLDGSATKPFMTYIVNWIDDGPTRTYYSQFRPTSSLLHDVAWGSRVLFYGALGLFGVAVNVLALVALARPRQVEFAHLAFPLAIILNWLVMSLGLAYDTKTSIHQDELLHRPFVWTYFIVAAWTGGLTYRLFLDEWLRRSPRWRNALAIAMVPMLTVPLIFGIEIQLGSERWGRALAFQSCPRGLFECAQYIRANAERGDLVQDSEADPKLLFSALCEHPAYAIAYFDGKPDKVLSGRIKELETFKAMIDAGSIQRFARDRDIRWYILAPRVSVNWPSSVLAQAAFTWQGYRVFKFTNIHDKEPPSP